MSEIYRRDDNPWMASVHVYDGETVGIQYAGNEIRLPLGKWWELGEAFMAPIRRITEQHE